MFAILRLACPSSGFSFRRSIFGSACFIAAYVAGVASGEGIESSAIEMTRVIEEPQIALISPYESPNIGWEVRGSIAFAVDVKGEDAISKVDFYVDDQHIYTDYDYPWGTLWNTRPLEPGNYSLKAICEDTNGSKAAISQVVSVAAPLTKAEATGSIIDSGELPNISAVIEDVNLRDTTVTVGPDGTYYLSGTGADNNAWFHNEGINLWKSADLKQWSYVGLIWSFERDGYADEKEWWTYKDESPFRAVWAPEFQYIHENFYITYSLQSKGSRLLRSASGRPEGPYELAAGTEVNFFSNIDGGLFSSINDPDIGYLCYESGNIVALNEGWNATAGPVTRVEAGDEGCFVFHWKGKYYLSNALFYDAAAGRRYSSWVGISDSPTGPYSGFHEAIPCGGHNTYFVDTCGTLWGTFFGNDKLSPWRERPAIVKIKTGEDGSLYPDPDQEAVACVESLDVA